MRERQRQTETDRDVGHNPEAQRQMERVSTRGGARTGPTPTPTPTRRPASQLPWGLPGCPHRDWRTPGSGVRAFPAVAHACPVGGLALDFSHSRPEATGRKGGPRRVPASPRASQSAPELGTAAGPPLSLPPLHPGTMTLPAHITPFLTLPPKCSEDTRGHSLLASYGAGGKCPARASCASP